MPQECKRKGLAYAESRCARHNQWTFLETMRGGLIDRLRSGVKITHIAMLATSFATVRSSYSTVLQHFPTELHIV